MKINNMKLVQSMNVLQGYMSKRLPQKISYAVMKNFSILSNEYQYYQKQYQKILEEYKNHIETDDEGNPKTDENGVPVIADATTRNEIYQALEELLSIEVDIDLHLVSDDCFDYEDSDRYDALTPAELYNLKLLLCENENQNK